MVIIFLQQSTFQRYAAEVLSTFFFIFAVFDWSLVITPLTSVTNYIRFFALRPIAQ